MKNFISKLIKLATSSTGEGISLRIKSFTAVIIFVAGLWGITINADQIGAGADQIGAIVTAFGALVSGMLHIYAWARANFYRAQSLGKYSKS